VPGLELDLLVDDVDVAALELVQVDCTRRNGLALQVHDGDRVAQDFLEHAGDRGFRLVPSELCVLAGVDDEVVLARDMTREYLQRVLLVAHVLEEALALLASDLNLELEEFGQLFGASADAQHAEVVQLQFLVLEHSPEEVQIFAVQNVVGFCDGRVLPLGEPLFLHGDHIGVLDSVFFAEQKLLEIVYIVEKFFGLFDVVERFDSK